VLGPGPGASLGPVAGRRADERANVRAGPVLVSGDRGTAWWSGIGRARRGPTPGPAFDPRSEPARSQFRSQLWKLWKLKPRPIANSTSPRLAATDARRAVIHGMRPEKPISAKYTVRDRITQTNGAP
jgi:hypothetical protein